MHVVRSVSRVIWRLAVLSLFFARPGLASTRPDWVTHPAQESGGYRLYVGRASHAPSETEGFNEATRDALERAILETSGSELAYNGKAMKPWTRSRPQSASRRYPVTSRSMASSSPTSTRKISKTAP